MSVADDVTLHLQPVKCDLREVAAVERVNFDTCDATFVGFGVKYSEVLPKVNYKVDKELLLASRHLRTSLERR